MESLSRDGDRRWGVTREGGSVNQNEWSIKKPYGDLLPCKLSSKYENQKGVAFMAELMLYLTAMSC